MAGHVQLLHINSFEAGKISHDLQFQYLASTPALTLALSITPGYGTGVLVGSALINQNPLCLRSQSDRKTKT